MNRKSTFPLGEKLPDKFARYFTGQAYLAAVAADKRLNCPVFNVTFEPGCRNYWHKHSGGQLLLTIDGEGLYQERGKPACLLCPGEAVEIAPNIEHWHGATTQSWFSHLAVETNLGDNQTVWLEAVTDADYDTAQPLTQTSMPPRLTQTAICNHEAWFPNYVSKVSNTDPELIEIFDNFAFDEILRHGQLDIKTRIIVTLASTIAQNTLSEYKMMLAAALANQVTPVEIKEILYQSVAYTGVARVIDFLRITNEEFEKRKIALPLPCQSTTSPEDRYAKGLALQKEIFGNLIDEMAQAAPKNQKHFQYFLSANCFGDYQTRTGLDKSMRELITFSLLTSLGGCEAQLKGHIKGNLAVGNNKEMLIGVITQLLPYIGYPRTLNTLKCLNDICP